MSTSCIFVSPGAVSIVVGFLLFAPLSNAQASTPELGPYGEGIERSHFVEMRDDIRLSANFYFPVGLDRLLATVLKRPPCNKAR